MFNFFFFFCMTAADQSKITQDQMSGAAMAMPLDPKAAFKAEWEALEICEHSWTLSNIEAELLESADFKFETAEEQNHM